MSADLNAPDRLLKLDEVRRKIGMGATWIYDRIRKGEFPRPLKLSERCVRWRERDINAWIDSLPLTRSEAP